MQPQFGAPSLCGPTLELPVCGAPFGSCHFGAPILEIPFWSPPFWASPFWSSHFVWPPFGSPHFGAPPLGSPHFFGSPALETRFGAFILWGPHLEPPFWSPHFRHPSFWGPLTGEPSFFVGVPLWSRHFGVRGARGPCLAAALLHRSSFGVVFSFYFVLKFYFGSFWPFSNSAGWVGGSQGRAGGDLRMRCRKACWDL